jgi:hypothetical protein
MIACYDEILPAAILDFTVSTRFPYPYFYGNEGQDKMVSRLKQWMGEVFLIIF